MASTTPKAFDEFKEHLRLTAPQRAAITARRDATVGYAESAFPADSDMPLSRTKLVGSAGRDTIIRPIDDVDLLAVFRNKDSVFEQYRYDSRAFLYKVRDALLRYSRVQVVGARGQ